MNRIILIGNGFDLAHGMKTSYKDFIDDYWGNVIKQIKERENRRFFEDEYGSISIRSIPANWGPGRDYNELMDYLKRDSVSYKINNTFLSHISLMRNDLNWVDIEDEYYRLLKKSLDPSNKTDRYEIDDLNRDFKVIKNKLTKYLQKVETEFDNTTIKFHEIKERIGSIVYQECNFNDFRAEVLDDIAKQELNELQEQNKLIEEDASLDFKLSERRKGLINDVMNFSDPVNHVKQTLKLRTASDYFNLNPEHILFLNFNYTATEKNYKNSQTRGRFLRDPLPNISTINIHGSIFQPDDNPVIFGFGDELDEEYKSIENFNENKYLENIKSINYLETGNYKTLLSIIESGYYEIFIFGHSCGISDRTLLNTMFEHDNCASIKVFYHERVKGDDNYSDVVRNISRNFNDKAKMRDRVVNKRSCEKLC